MVHNFYCSFFQNWSKMKGIGGFRKANPDDMERVVEKSDTSSSIVSDESIKPQSFREHVGEVIHSNKFQILVICLVVLDCLFVIAELLIDLKAFEQEAGAGHNATLSSSDDAHSSSIEAIKKVEEEEEPSFIAAEVLHYFSIAILSIFLLEIGVKLFVMGKSFFHHTMEVIDAVIVVVSFAFDIASVIDTEELFSAFGLLVLLRLWRIGRIVNGTLYVLMVCY